MNTEMSQKESLLCRTLFALALIMLAAALRVAPHPWNLTPVGAMALFSGAVLKDRRIALLVPLVALFAGDVFIGFHKLIPVVYASFLLNVLIGRFFARGARQALLGVGRSIFPGHQLCRLVALEFLCKNRLRLGRLLPRRPALLLEYARRRRLLRCASVWRIRFSRASFPRTAAARLPTLACMHSWPGFSLLCYSRVAVRLLEWRQWRITLAVCCLTP